MFLILIIYIFIPLSSFSNSKLLNLEHWTKTTRKLNKKVFKEIEIIYI